MVIKKMNYNTLLTAKKVKSKMVLDGSRMQSYQSETPKLIVCLENESCQVDSVMNLPGMFQMENGQIVPTAKIFENGVSYHIEKLGNEDLFSCLENLESSSIGEFESSSSLSSNSSSNSSSSSSSNSSSNSEFDQLLDDLRKWVKRILGVYPELDETCDKIAQFILDYFDCVVAVTDNSGEHEFLTIEEVFYDMIGDCRFKVLDDETKSYVYPLIFFRNKVKNIKD